MKNCPKCNANHEKPGKFCSRVCANSRGPRSEETKRKQSVSLIGKRKKSLKLGNCTECGAEFTIYRVDRYKYCSKNCAIIGIGKTRTANALKNKSAWQAYRKQCEFTFSVKDYPNVFDLSLIEEFGWYAASNKGNNLNGISRDHVVSVKFGYVNNVDPAIISHPANCKLLRHSENSSKNAKCGMTLDELKEKIRNWGG